jgi:site-specific DNA-methyltransferase (adenine-specific)
MTWTILTGDNRQTLNTIPDDSIDAIVTDPPYGIDFLGKAWDANTGALETYQECLRVLKPGGHILAFSAARTHHHLAVTLEQAGFEIRDQIMWIYSSGFPKSQDVGKSIERSEKKRTIGKGFTPDAYTGIMATSTNNERAGGIGACGQCGKNNMAFPQNYNACPQEPCFMREQAKPAQNEWAGWGTALKPAHEPIALARKPIKLSIAKNCQQWGVGALNIDATRVPFADDTDKPSGGENGWSRVGFSEQPVEKYKNQKKKKSDIDTYLNNKRGPMERARIADGENIGMFDGGVGYKAIKRKVDPEIDLPTGRFPSNVIGDIPDYQKYFYCPKVSRRERHIGHTLEVDRANMVEIMGGYWCDDKGTPGTDGKSVWLPHTGLIYAHGLTQVYADWCKKNNKDSGNVGNNHPTVKPIELMKYLIRLITPPGGTVLDPFTGSGSTGCAAVELGHPFIGCELDPRYVEIAQRRIGAWYDATRSITQFEALFE